MREIGYEESHEHKPGTMGGRKRGGSVQEKEELYWTSFAWMGGSLSGDGAAGETDGTLLHLMSSRIGLCRITWPDEGLPALEAWRDKHAAGAVLKYDPEKLKPYREQVEEYLNGFRREFTVSLDLRGTSFQLAIWRELATIPYGSTVSYSVLAARAGRPNAVRAAGAANGSNPLPLVIPCHRVIGKNGTLTGFRGGLPMKERLLLLEGAQS